MSICFVRPTPGDLYFASTILKKNTSELILYEAGRRTINEKLNGISDVENQEIIIILPFVYEPGIVISLKKLSENNEIHWYGDNDKKLLCNKCKEFQTVFFDDSMFSSTLDEAAKRGDWDDINDYLRYKITRFFLGSMNGDYDIRQLRDVVVNLSGYPRISSKEKKLAALSRNLDFPAIEGRSGKLLRLKKEIHRLAGKDINVLVLGETGTGKEAAAFFLHCLGEKEGGYGVVNCASLNEEYLISELFGHVEGAFTGAVKARDGLVKRLDHGTLFIDELPDMPERVQAMLLRFLQSGEYTPMGSDISLKVNVNIIAGGQSDRLSEKISGNKFRKDLYYRLAGKIIEAPCLRDIPDDIPGIIDNIVYKTGGVTEKQRNEVIHYFAKRMNELKVYAWPGNVRELANYVKRRLLLGEAEDIVLGGHEIDIEGDNSVISFKGVTSEDQIITAKEVYKKYITHVYKHFKENMPMKTIAARLGMSVNGMKSNIE